jgi:hypothetical protein
MNIRWKKEDVRREQEIIDEKFGDFSRRLYLCCRNLRGGSITVRLEKKARHPERVPFKITTLLYNQGLIERSALFYSHPRHPFAFRFGFVSLPRRKLLLSPTSLKKIINHFQP